MSNTAKTAKLRDMIARLDRLAQSQETTGDRHNQDRSEGGALMAMGMWAAAFEALDLAAEMCDDVVALDPKNTAYTARGEAYREQAGLVRAKKISAAMWLNTEMLP